MTCYYLPQITQNFTDVLVVRLFRADIGDFADLFFKLNLNLCNLKNLCDKIGELKNFICGFPITCYYLPQTKRNFTDVLVVRLFRADIGDFADVFF